MKLNISKILLSFIFIHYSFSKCSDYIHNFPTYLCEKETPFGEGSHGKAFVIIKDGIKFILKVQDSDYRSRKELKVMKGLKGQKYVVQLVDEFETSSIIFMIITMGENGNAFDYLQDNKDLSNDFILGFFQKLMEGVQAIHDSGFVHSDLKLDNVVVDKDLNPMIIDFDLAIEIDTEDGPRGTLLYMAPEVVKSFMYRRNVLYTPEIDLYSITVMFYEMYNQSKPYYLFMMDYLRIMETEIKIKPDTPRKFADFIKMGIMPESNRATFKKSQLNLMINFDIKDLIGEDENYSYKMIDFANDEEKQFNFDYRNPEEEIVMVMIIGLALIIGSCFGIYLCIFCCCFRQKKIEQYPLVHNVNNMNVNPMNQNYQN